MRQIVYTIILIYYLYDKSYYILLYNQSYFYLTKWMDTRVSTRVLINKRAVYVIKLVRRLSVFLTGSSVYAVN